MGVRGLRAVVAIMVALSAPVLVSCTGADERGGADPPQPTRQVEAPTPTLTTPRAVHRATVLEDGRVLFTGGCTLPGCGGFDEGRQSEVFDPAAESFTGGSPMVSARAGHTATLLRDGRVLLVGGYPGEGRSALSSAEVFDPATGRFHEVGHPATGRADHSATLLPTGKVLVAGGTTGRGDVLRSTELFDPVTGRFRSGPPLSAARAGHVAALTRGDVVLIGGTADLDAAVATTDVMENGSWSPGPVLREQRVKHAAVTLADRTILVIGGGTDTEGREMLASTELLRLDAARSRPGPRLSEARYKLDGAVTTLDDGRVVIAGGRQLNVYDPETGQMSVVDAGPVERRSFTTASTLGASTVLLAGGYDSAITPTAEALLVDVGSAA